MRVAALCLLLAAPLLAQDSLRVPTPLSDDGAMLALEQLLLERSEIRADIDTLRVQLETAAQDAQAALTAQLSTQLARRDEVGRQIVLLASGLDPNTLETDELPSLTLEQEAKRLLSPLISEFNEMTKRSRQINDLRLEIVRLEELITQVDRARDRTTRFLGKASDSVLVAELRRVDKAWKDQRTRLGNNLAVVSHQLEAELEQKSDVLTTAQDSIKNFVTTRGLNLALALLAALITFVALRLLYRLASGLLGRLTPKRRAHYGRLLNVSFYVLSSVSGFAAFMIVLSLLGDWVLFSLFSIALIVLLWTAQRWLPPAWEQIRLLLNLGAVREGERLVYEGVPWRVETLGLAVKLENPAFPDFSLRLPLRDMIGRVSRRYSPDEAWFPSRVGDDVILADGTLGTVRSQSHEAVVLEVGTSRKTYTTGAYLDQSPLNLSTGFRLRSIFGIDYKHQAEATDAIPRKLQELVEGSLRAQRYGEHLRRVEVDFCEAAGSSLNLELEVIFDGAGQRFHKQVQDDLQRFAVDAANQMGWEIPFPQLTVHKS